MRTDGYADGVLAVAVGVDNLTICHAGGAVDGELHAVHGDVGAGVHDFACDGETGDIGEIVVVERHRTRADEAGACAGREFVDAQFGLHGIAGTAWSRHKVRVGWNWA